MKKKWILGMLLLLALSLTACGGKKEDTKKESKKDAPLTREDSSDVGSKLGGLLGGKDDAIDSVLGGLLSGNSSDLGEALGGLLGSDDSEIDNNGLFGDIGLPNYGELDELTKQAILEDAKENGYEVSFGPDGTMTIIDEDGVAVQNSDGTWSYEAADGSENTFLGDKWPDNKYTKLVSNPGLTIYMSAVNDNNCEIYFQGASLEDIKSYAKKLASDGYNKNDQTEEITEAEFSYFSYAAENSKRNCVELTWTSDLSVLTIYEESPLGDDDYEADSFYSSISGLLPQNQWPDIELTEDVPKPDATILMVYQDSDTNVQISCDAIPTNQAKAYMAKVKAAGFDVAVDEGEFDLGDVIMYYFNAENAIGKSIKITASEMAFAVVVDSSNVYVVNREWPSFGYSSYIEKPSMDIEEIVANNERDFEVKFSSSTSVEEMMDYAEVLKRCGFTYNVKTEEGEGSFFFVAEEESGLRATLEIIGDYAYLYMTREYWD